MPIKIPFKLALVNVYVCISTLLMEKLKADQAQVAQHIAGLPEPFQAIVNLLSSIALASHTDIAAHIKWNSPSFYYTGVLKDGEEKAYTRDLLVCNLHRGKLLAIFPTAAKIADEMGGKNYPDGRKILEIKSLSDLTAKQSGITALIRQWIALIA